MVSSSPDRTKIFISYSRKDKEHLERLKVHLSSYIDGDVKEWVWDDTQIQTGVHWCKEMDEALEQASAAILLISADFMATRFIRENELPPLLQAAEKKGIRIMPVILSPCGFEGNKNLSQFQAAHLPSEPLSSMRGKHKREQWWANVAKNIHSVIVAQEARLASSDVAQMPADLNPATPSVPAISKQEVKTEMASALRSLQGHTSDDYTEEQFAKDVEKYVAYIKEAFHYLKIVGVVPKEQIKDPELEDIFVPLRIELQDPAIPEGKKPDSITDILEQYPCTVLLGGPGSGKSTATRYLAWSHAIANQPEALASYKPLLSGHPLPLRIELRRFVEDRRKHNYNFLSYAFEVLGREGIEINPRMFKELLARRTMLLLFDGLDEVATLDERRRLVEEIERFTLNYSGNRVLVTSRPVGYELAPLSNQWFMHGKIQDFSDEQIWQFLESWYNYVLRLPLMSHDEQQELEILFKTLKENPRLHKLAVNPLLLTVITAMP